MAKEPYVKPTVKSEILKAEVLYNNHGSGGTCNCGPGGLGGYPWLHR
jgi:hypothetical protein